MKENRNGMKKGTGKPGVTARILLIVQIACIGAAAGYLARQKILPIRYFAPAVAVLAAVTVLQFVLLFGKNKKLAKQIVSFIISIALIIAMLAGMFFLVYTYGKLDTITEKKNVKTSSTVEVYVRKEDGYTDISQLKGKTFGELENVEEKNADLAAETLSEVLGEDIQPVTASGVLPLAQSLQDKSVDAIIINASLVSLITDNDETFTDWAECLYTFDADYAYVGEGTEDASDSTSSSETSEASATHTPVENVSVDPFILYIQGMDTRGDMIVSDRGNADVNILMVVNPNTHKILLVNTPRDYYYYLWGDTSYPDKLTHAGCYGIDCSIATLQSLYSIDINYYVRVGFNSVTNIVDALGGITVESEYDFEIGGYTFTKGTNELDGEAALAFSRERKSLPGGDRARGANQQRVIKGIINKIMSPAILANYTGVLDALTSNTVTDMPVESMNELVYLQLDKNPSWEVSSIAVDGAGAWDYCYALGAENDVMTPDWSTVEAAKTQINAVLAGGE